MHLPLILVSGSLQDILIFIFQYWRLLMVHSNSERLQHFILDPMCPFLRPVQLYFGWWWRLLCRTSFYVLVKNVMWSQWTRTKFRSITIRIKYREAANHCFYLIVWQVYNTKWVIFRDEHIYIYTLLSELVSAQIIVEQVMVFVETLMKYLIPWKNNKQEKNTLVSLSIRKFITSINFSVDR